MVCLMNVNPLSAANGDDASARQGSIMKLIAILFVVAALLAINSFVIG